MSRAVMSWFCCYFIWIWLLVAVFADIFRSHELSGWAKALWLVLVLVLPHVGVRVHLIARGKVMSRHSIEDARARDGRRRQDIQGVAGSSAGPADEIDRLMISEDEFVAGKTKVLTGP